MLTPQRVLKKCYTACREKKVLSYNNTVQHFFFLSNADNNKLLEIFLATDSRMNYVTKIILLNNSEEFKGEERERICANLKKILRIFKKKKPTTFLYLN